MIDYRIEDITYKDIDFIVDSLSNEETRRLSRGPDYPKVTPETIKFEIDNSSGAWWIIYDGSKKVGWVRLTPFSLYSAGMGIVLADPEYRNKGWGYEICHMILFMALSIYKEVYWSTWLYNHGSLKLADKLGFEPVSVSNEHITLLKRKVIK